MHKLANPWILPSINNFPSKISADNWDITPNYTHYIETAHAGRNTETAIGVGLTGLELEAYPTTLLMGSSGTAQDLLNDDMISGWFHLWVSRVSNGFCFRFFFLPLPPSSCPWFLAFVFSSRTT
jgi:hypothetical protein